MDVSKIDPPSPFLISTIRTVPSLIVLLLPLLFSIPPFKQLGDRLAPVFSDFVTLRSLVPPEPATSAQKADEQARRPKAWKGFVLAAFSLAEAATWTGITGWKILQLAQGDGTTLRDTLLSIGMVVVWLGIFSIFAFRPLTTPPWSILIISILLFVVSAWAIGQAWYIRTITGFLPSWASSGRITLEFLNIGATATIILVLGSLKLASPEVLSRLPQVAPDDDVTLLSWMTFGWVDSFIRYGNSQELEPEDLPLLSMTQQTRIVSEKFRQAATSKLVYKLFLANKLDMALDGSLTLVSVILNYAGPFFLNRILQGLDTRSREAMSRAYVFALFALFASVSKALVDLLHLWHSRRAAVRIKAELTAAVYDKALRRKDASGIVSKTGAEDKESDGKQEKMSNADSGKVVNLMSGDTTRIANTVSGAYFIYSAPFEILVASIFLYNILGWSAFAGIVVLAVAAPLNSFVSSRSVKITQDLLKARDKRIGVMNELIGAIQFIKFFAWIEQWKGRAAEARSNEMKQMIRSLINNVWFALLWSLAPILVTLVSFFCYIVIEKRDLTVSVAFTAISLFTMLRLPLNIIPSYIVIILQSLVSVQRIEDFLAEDEVPDWVSSLKRSETQNDEPTKIGFENASFRWNTGKQSSLSGTIESSKGKQPASAPAPLDGSVVTDGSTVVEETFFMLSDLNINFPIGRLSVITGPTGSGKTALLTALLGEMELLSGRSYLPKNTTQVDSSSGLRNSIAYAAQTPWLQQTSIKNNILFGEPFDEERYEMVLEACALNPDLDALEDGDMTEIGAKGVSLSGGQKARVALARAVYSYTQHLLLDDPLAAVDSHTAKHLTDKCLDGPILKGRTVVLVSHHVELLLPSTDYLVRILDGRVDIQGTIQDLRERGDLDGMVALEEAELLKEEDRGKGKSQEEEVVEGEDADVQEIKKEKNKGPGKKLIQDEERAIGNVKWETYKLYIVAATYTTWAWTLLVLILSQLCTVAERYWLKVWGEAYSKQHATTLFTMFKPAIHDLTSHYFDNELHQHVLQHSVSENVTFAASEAVSVDISGITSQFPSAETDPTFYLAVYTAIVLGAAILGVASSGIGAWSSYRAAVTIHDRLLDRIMRATVRFFSVTPLGRIINRFSRDVEVIDSSLNGALRTVLIYVASLLAAIGVVAFIVPWFLVPAALISYLYYQYSVLYLRVGRSLRRLEATLRSPIFSGFAELLDGVISVRAFSAEARFMEQLCKQVDQTNQAFYYYWMMNRWLLLRFDFLGAISVALTTWLALSGAVPAGSAGMAIVSAQSFVSACYWVSRFWGQLEMDFNSVERVQEYLSVPQEPPAVIPSNRPPAYWPANTGAPDFLSVRDIEIKYAPDLPTVFKGSFDIKAGEKIGLIGRTGSGKSTLGMSLLRFTDPTSGSIVLDGIDITKIGVDDLRSRITYIPQDAVLFSGTVRENLDPFAEHTDVELYDALARVNLGPHGTSPLPSRIPSRVASSRRLDAIIAEESAARSSASSALGSALSSANARAIITLTTEVSAGGSNFSQGQRQLVAMARALLRRSNLIIMDEATASVDFATDEAIQAAIRSEFKDSTLLTIAHRLSSVIDYDRLLVLSDGAVAEFDTPINLLRKDGSLFKTLCEKSGKYKELFKAAEKKEQEDQEKESSSG
ncbi:ATP-binding cassette transporter [Cryptococcus deuterogattii R265]|uniref:ATP-binding cassette transporter n=1 Tax=Cryptococcus deuterogattii (strain R265) TaxID=294750 RepID=UPI0019368421|nr:ATP-binding cassette transporter [Cryptococcus deuterogattii R265]